MIYNEEKHDLRWSHTDSTKMSYIKTLTAMCNYYGTFCGRWHNNEFWERTKKQIPNMTEEEAKVKVFEIENEAEGSLEEWRRYQ